MIKVTVLGCGSSGGVPLIGCTCPVCMSSDAKNKRMRVSLLIESGDTTILIDTSPDMRMQCLKHNISKVDGIIFTHAHADHLNGVDDVRSFNFAKNGPLDIFADEHTISDIKTRFAYAFLPPKPAGDGWYRPCLTPHVVTPFVPFKMGGIEIMPFEQTHGFGQTLGLRIGNFAYSTDTNALPEKSFEVLQGLDVWIVDCLRYEPAPTHAHLAMSLEWIAQVKPKTAYLTHMNHTLDYNKLASELPPGVEPAYDGLVFTV